MQLSPILSVSGLSKSFTVHQTFHAVKNVSFDVYENEILGIIGESGSGKSTTALLVMALLEPTQGSIRFLGKELTQLSKEELRVMRKDIQIVFQHTMPVLDPKMHVEKLIQEPLEVHNIVPRSEYLSEVRRLLAMVGLGDEALHKFPNQLSGGQYQRVIIARAIATRPRLIVCDEPVSALDVSVQGQILNLLIDLQKALNLSYVLISHDLKVIRAMCHRTLVMHRGEIVESGDTLKLLSAPKHAHTKALIEAIL